MDPLNNTDNPDQCPPVFDIDNNDSSNHNRPADSSVDNLTPHQHGPRTEQKLSLSKYESVRSRSTSGERTPVDQEQRTVTESNTSEGRDVEAMVKVENTDPGSCVPGPSTSTPLRPGSSTDTTIRTNIQCFPVQLSDTVSSSTVSDEDRSRGSNRGNGVSSSRGGNSKVDYRYVKVPVVGFEVMEQRTKFTVFQLQVQNGDNDYWYVFRRYSDFVRLQHKLKVLFPMLRLALPPKRWFRDNFDPNFLDDRRLGLQAFIDSILCHRDLYTSVPVQQFFCFNDPPGPHDSLEESRAYCEELEESLYSLKKVVRERDSELELLREELGLYKSQVEILSRALRESNTNGASASNSQVNTLPSPANSLAECDLLAPEADQSQPAIQTCDKSQLENGTSKEVVPAQTRKSSNGLNPMEGVRKKRVGSGSNKSLVRETPKVAELSASRS